MENYINYIYGVLGLVIGFIVPVAVRKSKVLIGFIKGKLGNATYAECKTFLVNLAELHKEDFAEDKIVGLLDLLDNKFGDHLNKIQIKEIVDFVKNTIEVDVAKAIV